MGTVYFSVALIVVLGMLALRRASALAGRHRSHRQLGPVLRHHELRHVAVQRHVSAHAAGLETCYVAAIPFFQNTLAGDLFYAALLFGGFAMAERMIPQIRGAGRRSPPDPRSVATSAALL